MKRASPSGYMLRPHRAGRTCCPETALDYHFCWTRAHSIIKSSAKSCPLRHARRYVLPRLVSLLLSYCDADVDSRRLTLATRMSPGRMSHGGHLPSSRMQEHRGDCAEVLFLRRISLEKRSGVKLSAISFPPTFPRTSEYSIMALLHISRPGGCVVCFGRFEEASRCLDGQPCTS